MSRPESLYPLFGELTRLPGVGPKVAGLMENLGVTRPRDLIFTLPHGVIDRRRRETVQGLDFPATATVEVLVGRHSPPRQKGRPYRVTVEDARLAFQLVFFHARGDYLARILPEGSRRVISGRLELFDGVPQMVHPDHILPPEEAAEIPEFEPVYPLTHGLTQKQMSRAAEGALGLAPDPDEWIDASLVAREGWPGWKTAIAVAHHPVSKAAVGPADPARRRLAYDELFAHQLTLALARSSVRRRKGVSSSGDGRLRGRVVAALPYAPTWAQERSVQEIAADMAAPTRMNRLLQGDVGSGKTLVAMLALMIAVEAGGQGVMMAPTGILARQHYESLTPMAEAAGVRLEILTSADKGAPRAAKLADLAAGRIDVLVGTHSVFQADVHFHDLRLAIVDEQHRFGVRERLELGKKGPATDVLVMTATPIPRSLALAQYGDLDVSVLDEKPPGREPVTTALVPAERIEEVIARLEAAIGRGARAYWVCPLVDESEVMDLTAAEERFKALRARFGEGRVALVHGQMGPDDRARAMTDFQTGRAQVLVATTVIEVGVDVPEATIIVIEQAERFGLAQLHQLRGRVGRGGGSSTCLLVYQGPLTESAGKRLAALRETDDGFRIAETDLAIRGAGDLIGTAQSGVPRFRIADPERDYALLKIAQTDARALLEMDPTLTSKRGEAARLLLWLTDQDSAIRLISVG